MISVDLLRKGLAVTSVLGGASKVALPGSNVSDERLFCLLVGHLLVK